MLNINLSFPYWENRWICPLLRGQGLNIDLLNRCKKLFELCLERAAEFTALPESNEEFTSYIHGRDKIEASKKAAQHYIPQVGVEPTRKELYNWGVMQSWAVVRRNIDGCFWKDEELYESNECYYVDRLFYSRMELDKLKLLKQLTLNALELARKIGRYQLPPLGYEADPSLVLFFQRTVFRKKDELSVRLAKDNPYAKDLPAMQKEFDNWEYEVRVLGKVPSCNPRSGPIQQRIGVQSIEELNDSLDKDIALREKNPKALLHHFSYDPLYEKKLSRSLTITSIAISVITLGVLGAYCLYSLNPVIGLAIARLVNL
jgi:hypothetical protein